MNLSSTDHEPRRHRVRTTGNAGFCGDVSLGPINPSRDCHQDTDRAEEFGSGAACITRGGICNIVCPQPGGTACMPACVNADM